MMNSKSLFRIWLVILIGIVLSYCYLDRPLCEFFEHHPLREGMIALLRGWFPWILDAANGKMSGWSLLVHWTEVMGWLSPFLLLAVCWMPPGKQRDLILLMSMSLLTTLVLKNDLKDIFGRDWPISWGGNHASWIKNRAYGFHFFQSGLFTSSDTQGSFPSGHAALAFATLLPIGLIFPKALPWLLLVAAGEGLLLVFMNYHFLSDVLAGALLGIFCTIVVHAILKLSSPLRSERAAF
jgi:membrane-associated phospholipid phosphatase